MTQAGIAVCPGCIQRAREADCPYPHQWVSEPWISHDGLSGFRECELCGAGSVTRDGGLTWTKEAW